MRYSGTLPLFCSVSVFESVFVVAVVMHGHGSCPRAAGLRGDWGQWSRWGCGGRNGGRAGWGGGVIPGPFGLNLALSPDLARNGRLAPGAAAGRDDHRAARPAQDPEGHAAEQAGGQFPRRGLPRTMRSAPKASASIAGQFLSSVRAGQKSVR